MAKVQLRHKSTRTCYLCGKGDTVSTHRPHSLHRTKRIVKPNLQTKWGYTFCQNCFRTIKKKGIDPHTFGRQLQKDKNSKVV